MHYEKGIDQLWKIFLRLHLLCRGLPMAPPHGFVPLQPIESCRCAGSRGDDGGLQSAPHRARVRQPGSPTPPAKSASTRSPRPSSKRERDGRVGSGPRRSSEAGRRRLGLAGRGGRASTGDGSSEAVAAARSCRSGAW
jgi:hypothetical protein